MLGGQNRRSGQRGPRAGAGGTGTAAPEPVGFALPRLRVCSRPDRSTEDRCHRHGGPWQGLGTQGTHGLSAAGAAPDPWEMAGIPHMVAVRLGAAPSLPPRTLGHGVSLPSPACPRGRGSVLLSCSPGHRWGRELAGKSRRKSLGFHSPRGTAAEGALPEGGGGAARWGAGTPRQHRLAPRRRLTCPVLPAGPTATARSTSTTATNASTAA